VISKLFFVLFLLAAGYVYNEGIYLWRFSSAELAVGLVVAGAVFGFVKMMVFKVLFIVVAALLLAANASMGTFGTFY